MHHETPATMCRHYENGMDVMRATRTPGQSACHICHPDIVAPVLYDMPTGQVAMVEYDNGGHPYAVLWGSESDRQAEDPDHVDTGWREHTSGSLSGYDTLAELLADMPGATRREVIR